MPGPAYENYLCHLNSSFSAIDSQSKQVIPLTLIQIIPQSDNHPAKQYTLLFQGPMQPIFKQKIYHIEHKDLGDMDLFMVPVAKNEHGVQYEVVFNSP